MRSSGPATSDEVLEETVGRLMMGAEMVSEPVFGGIGTATAPAVACAVAAPRASFLLVLEARRRTPNIAAAMTSRTTVTDASATELPRPLKATRDQPYALTPADHTMSAMEMKRAAAPARALGTTTLVGENTVVTVPATMADAVRMMPMPARPRVAWIAAHTAAGDTGGFGPMMSFTCARLTAGGGVCEVCERSRALRGARTAHADDAVRHDDAVAVERGARLVEADAEVGGTAETHVAPLRDGDRDEGEEECTTKYARGDCCEVSAVAVRTAELARI
jgi:hypothetical protein